jgi:hypothetical protein
MRQLERGGWSDVVNQLEHRATLVGAEWVIEKHVNARVEGQVVGCIRARQPMADLIHGVGNDPDGHSRAIEPEVVAHDVGFLDKIRLVVGNTLL